MYFVISPTKDMKLDNKNREQSVPAFLVQSKLLMSKLQQLSIDDLMRTMQVNEKLAQLNKQRFTQFDFHKMGNCAIDTYDGLQFKQMEIDKYDTAMLAYLQTHIRILSGLYGVLSPFDSIHPYRLEMKYKPFALYDFWKQPISDYFKETTIINVASEEYGKLLEGDVYHIVFKMYKREKYVTQSTQVKMARGKFIDYVVKKQVQTLEEIKLFKEDGYCFNKQLSSERVFVFVKEVNDESIN